MQNEHAFERCLSFINCQLEPSRLPARYTQKGLEQMAVTISRQTGSGAMAIALKLADFLEARSSGACHWTVFDKNLIEKVLEEHHLPKHLAKFLPEDSSSMINDIMDELLGLHPPSWTVVHQTTETVLHLAQLGKSILIGRGATAVCARLPNVFHVRLVAPLDKRVARIMESNKLSHAQALEFIKETEQARARYLKKNFKTDIEDPLIYHLVINTGRFSEDEVARIVGEAILNFAEQMET